MSSLVDQPVYKLIAVLLSLFFVMIASADEKEVCAPILAGSNHLVFVEQNPEANSYSNLTSNGTGHFIDLGEKLIRDREITAVDLRRFLDESAPEKVVNLILKTDGMSTRATFHYELFQEYIDYSQLNAERLSLWAQERLENMGKAEDDRGATQETTHIIYQRLKFSFVPKGSYYHKRHSVSLRQDLEMSSTKVTQWDWGELMLENPSHFTSGHGSAVVRHGDVELLMKPLYPVENISWCSALVFANRMSEKYGYKPAYDLSGLQTTGRAENGTLDCKGTLVINAPDGDIVCCEGNGFPVTT